MSVRESLLGRCTDDVCGRHEPHRRIQVEFAGAPELLAQLFIHAAQVESPTYLGKIISIFVQRLNQRRTDACTPVMMVGSLI